ncbi:uncharacterized protein PtrM4_152960 [Pyrenophora tritici-repentis]|uniref:Uncharacterized protein n=1 Tax=Pyrenophora tritici-repentis TaxID=45151 RepID=A0A834RIS4_9PLEO|nr:hypothetical protein PtrM4_152960 [Pyrenophora tritici-repentis]
MPLTPEVASNGRLQFVPKARARAQCNGTALYRRPSGCRSQGSKSTRGELANCCPSNSVYKYETSNGRPAWAVNSPNRSSKPWQQAAGNGAASNKQPTPVAATWAKMVQPRRLGAASSCVALVGAQFKGLSPERVGFIQHTLHSVPEWLSKSQPTPKLQRPPLYDCLWQAIVAAGALSPSANTSLSTRTSDQCQWPP